MYRDSTDLNRRLGILSNTQHGSSGRSLSEVLAENPVQFSVLAHILQIYLRIDHVLHSQTCGFDYGFYVVERLADLRHKSRPQTAVRTTRPLPGDVEIVSRINAGRVETICLSRRLRGNDGP